VSLGLARPLSLIGQPAKLPQEDWWVAHALGITCLWITPVYLSIGRYEDSDGYHGYWALDFEKIDPHLYSKIPSLAEGSKEYLKKYLDKKTNF